MAEWLKAADGQEISDCLAGVLAAERIGSVGHPEGIAIGPRNARDPIASGAGGHDRARLADGHKIRVAHDGDPVNEAVQAIACRQGVARRQLSSGWAASATSAVAPTLANANRHTGFISVSSIRPASARNNLDNGL